MNEGERETTYNDRRGVFGGRGLPPHSRWSGQPQPWRPPLSLVLYFPNKSRGLPKPILTTNVGSVGSGVPKKICPMLKGEGLFQGGNV